jgi:hypothetical protein
MSLCEVSMIFLLHPFRLFLMQCSVTYGVEHGIKARIPAGEHDGE